MAPLDHIGGEMTPTDLLDWQERMGFIGTEAAQHLGIPYMTYREYLPTGRRRAGRLPGWLPRLCAYIERFGPLTPPPDPGGPARSA